MAYETKVLLIAIAQHAVSIGSKEMYDYITLLANAESEILQPYESAIKQ